MELLLQTRINIISMKLHDLHDGLSLCFKAISTRPVEENQGHYITSGHRAPFVPMKAAQWCFEDKKISTSWIFSVVCTQRTHLWKKKTLKWIKFFILPVHIQISECNRNPPLHHIHTALPVFRWSTLRSEATLFLIDGQEEQPIISKNAECALWVRGTFTINGPGNGLQTGGPLHQQERGGKLENLGVDVVKKLEMEAGVMVGVERGQKMMMIYVSWCKLMTNVILYILR